MILRRHRADHHVRHLLNQPGYYRSGRQTADQAPSGDASRLNAADVAASPASSPDSAGPSGSGSRISGGAYGGEDVAGDHAQQRLVALAAGPGGEGQRTYHHPKRGVRCSRYTRPFSQAARSFAGTACEHRAIRTPAHAGRP